MLAIIWIALLACGVLLSTAAFYVRRASLYAATLGFGVWLVVAISSTSIVTYSGGTEFGAAAPAVAILAVVNAVAHLPVAYLSYMGEWEPERRGDDVTGFDSGAPKRRTR